MKQGTLIIVILVSAVLFWGGVAVFIACSNNPKDKAVAVAEKALMASVDNPQSVKIIGISKADSVFGKEYVKEKNSTGVHDVDLTKLVIDVRGLNRFGYDVFKEIRKESNIQLELGEVSVVLAIVGPGTTKEHVDRLIDAFKRLSKEHYRDGKKISVLRYRFSYPTRVRAPRAAYDAPSKVVSLKDAVGEISEETIRAYPPGIPIILPGERVNKETLKRISFYRKEKGQILKDTKDSTIKVVERK